MAILVTGAAGFIGSHVAHHLIRITPGIPIITIDKLGYCSSLANVPHGVTFQFGDVCDAKTTRQLFKAFDIKQLVHCAADSHVDHSFKSPSEFVRNNISSTQTLLEAAVEFGVEKFLHFSTDEVYGPCDQQHVATESMVLNPTNPYSASKAATDLLVQTYQKCFNLPAVITRCNNVYGPRQYPEKIIPKFITRLLSNKPCMIQGSGKHMRTYVYATDVARAVELILQRGQIGQVYNIGSEDEFSNNDIARLLVDKIRPHHKAPIQYTTDRPFNDDRYRIDYSKIQSLGWQPRVSFQDGIDATIDWYKASGTSQWAPIGLNQD